MTKLLALQLLISFVAGGCFIAFLSLLAERAHASVSGIIMMLPSTVVLGFFFLGWATSAEQVAAIVPATLIPLGVVMLSAVVYIHFSLFFFKHFRSRKTQLIITFCCSSITWFVLAAPFAVFRFSNLYLGIAGYAALAMLAHYLLNRRPAEGAMPAMRYTKKQIAARAIFIGTLIAGIVLVGKKLDPFWGGIFTLYPAATFGALMVFHYYYEPKYLFHFMRRAPAGSISIFMYSLSVMVLFPRFGFVLGTVFAYAICLAYSLIMIRYKLKSMRKKR